MTVVPFRKPLTLGGSEIPAVLGLDPFVSPYALACRKLGVTSDPPASEAATLGTLLEDAHIRAVEADGYTVICTDGIELEHPELEWLRGHPDALVAVDGEHAPLELKARGVTPTEHIRMRDTVQALIYAELAGSSRAMVSELCGGYGGFQRIEWWTDRDDDLFAAIVTACEAFLATVAKGKCPAPDGSDSAREAIRDRYAGTVGETCRLSAKAVDALVRFREYDYMEKEAKRHKERYAQVVQDEMGDAVEAYGTSDLVVARFTPVTSNRMDTTRLRRDHPDMAAEYTTATSYRRFEVV